MPRATNVRPTRMELLRIRRRIAIARKGLRLLKLKRQALILEFFRMSKEAAALRSDLRNKLRRAYESVRIAEMLVGPLRLEYESMRIPTISPLGVATKNVMGVRIPELGQGAVFDGAEQLLEMPASINQVVRVYRELHLALLNVAEKETALRRLLLEIEKTKRRSNAIENILIPRLEQNAKYIKFVFDEMERESFTKLKTVKRKMAQREGGGI
ncbi:MAG: V-type ATP synthase subunit D [Thermoprotei archaeon]